MQRQPKCKVCHRSSRRPHQPGDMDGVTPTLLLTWELRPQQPPPAVAQGPQGHLQALASALGPCCGGHRVVPLPPGPAFLGSHPASLSPVSRENVFVSARSLSLQG